MRRAILLSAAFLAALPVGCGSSEPADDPVATDAASEVVIDTGAAVVDSGAALDSSVADSSSPPGDASSDVVIFPVEDTGPPPVCGIPAGTTATASANNGSAGLAFDGNLTTFWATGGTAGTLRIAFPKATRFDRVRINAKTPLGTPTATFGLTGRLAKTTVPLGSIKGGLTVAAKWLPEATVPVANYDGLDIASSASVPPQIVEVYVYDSTGGCTPP